MASSSICKNNFEVFLSFRGEDTRYTFTDRLFENLDRVGIHTFRDDQLERGEEIKSELLKTIEDSRISILVFSKTYAHSKWCLDELAKIMKCREEMDQIVLPVFYHVDPCDVRKQTGSFGEAFSVHEGKAVDEKKMKMWRDSLTEASNLSGFHVNDGYESKHIEEIINEVSKRLNPKLLHIDDNMVGINCCLEKLNSLLISNFNVCVVGIYGTGGIGKTSIAKILYNTIQCQFTGASFLEDVREKCKTGHQLQLQQQLLGDMVGNDIHLRDINEGINMIKERFSSKKVLIAIDDVDQLEQFKFLVGNREWFGFGSRIIITTRDQHLLAEYGVDRLYEVKQLHGKDALQLFSQHAFKQSFPKEGYADLSNCMIKYAQGLPLALKVLGSYLQSMTIDEWKSALDKLKKNLKPEIDRVLRISYDGLDQYEKEVFLDIACFFKGECKDVVLRILDGCDLFATCGIRVLQDRCLVSVSDNNAIHMHDLIQQMGWEVVRGEYRGDPIRWSRLWDVDDIYDAFSRQEGMENIQTISLHLSELKEIQFPAKVFAKMKKLRLLKIYCDDHDDLMRNEYKVLLPTDFEFPRNLRYLDWQRCNLRSLPSKFCGENIMEIKLKSSNIEQLWERNQCLGKLCVLDLNNSKQLVKMPKFSSMPNLERLNLEGCTNLCELDSSIGDLKRLVYLNLGRCEQLQSFPPIKKFDSLEVLYLNNCPNLKKFPEIHGSMEHLTRLNLSESGIKELPSSIMYLASLEVLDLSNCSNLEKFPEIHREMKSMTELHLSGCSKFEKFPDIFTFMRRLEELFLLKCGIKELPDSIGHLDCLRMLDLSGCSKFEKFPEIRGSMKCLTYLYLDKTAIKELPNSIGSLTSLKTLSLKKCSRFEKFSDIFGNMGLLWELYLDGTAIKELPNSIGSLTSLETLSLKKCSRFEKISDIFGNMGCLWELYLDGTAIKELPNSLGSLSSLETLSLKKCSRFEKISDIFSNMGRLSELYLDETAIKELPNSIGSLTSLKTLSLSKCSSFEKISDIFGNMELLRKLSLDETFIKELPNSIGCLQALEFLSLSGCSKFERFPKFKKDVKNLSHLYLEGTVIKELPSSIGQLTGLKKLILDNCTNLASLPNSVCGNLTSLELFNCNNLVALPDCIGKLTCLNKLQVHNCSKLQYLPDNLRSLQCSLTELDLGGCNLTEEQIPSDLWGLSLLETLDLSKNRICYVPTGITQFCELSLLLMNHCPMLKEIGELPSNKTLQIQVYGCPYLQIETSSSSLLWSSLLKHYKKLRPHGPMISVVGSSSGIPKWVSHQRMGSEIRIELPMNWYEDDNFLGLALFFYCVLVGDECNRATIYDHLECELMSEDEQSERLDAQWFRPCCDSNFPHTYHETGSTTDPAIRVIFLPWHIIPHRCRSRRWNSFKAHYCRLSQGKDGAFKVKSCGIHIIYDQLGEVEHHRDKKRPFNLIQGIKDFFNSSNRQQ